MTYIAANCNLNYTIVTVTMSSHWFQPIIIIAHNIIASYLHNELTLTVIVIMIPPHAVVAIVTLNT